MGQYKEGQRLQGSDGKIYVVKNGVPVTAGAQALVPNQKLPGELAGQGLSNTHQSITNVKDQATLPFDIRAAKAQAEKAEIDARNAKDQYDAQHPSVNTSGLYGPDYLKTLSPSDQATIKALDEGRLAFPQGAGLRSPFWQEKLSQVAQYDPTFDATNFNARAKGRAAAIAGKLGASNNALNTAMGHVGTLFDQIGGTASHGGFPFATTVNAVENWYSKGHGDPGVTNYIDTASKLADELESVYRNGGGAEAGVVRQLRNLDVNASQEQKMGIVRNALDLLSSKAAANLAQYNFGTGGKPQWDMLDQHTQDLLNRPEFKDIRDKYFVGIDPGANGNTPPPGFTPPPTGGTGDLGPSTNGYSDKPNPEASAFWESAARNGLPYRQALKDYSNEAKMRGNAVVTPPTPGQYHKVVDYLQTNKNADYHPFDAVTRTPLSAQGIIPGTTLFSDADMNRAAQTGTGAFVGHTLNNLTAGAPARVAGDQGQYYNAVSNQQHPYLSTAGDIAGAVGGAVGTGKIVGKAFPALSAGKTALVGDTLYGGVTGEMNNPDHPILGPLAGAGAMLAGNGLGRYVFGPGLAAAGDTKLGQSFANLVIGGSNKVRGMFGGGSSAPFSPPSALDPGQSLIFGQAGKDAIGDIQGNLTDAARLNLPYALADAHPKLRLLAGSATRKSPDARTIAENVIGPRQLGQGERAIQQINSNLAPVGDVPTLQANTLKTAQAQSNPLYAAAKAEPVPDLSANPVLKEVLDRPAAQGAIRKGYETALNKGEDVGTLTYATGPNGEPIQYGNPSWNVIHYARQELDKAGEPEVRHALDGQIRNLNPGFKAADAKYSGIIKGSDALQSGADATAIKVTPEATQRTMAGFPNNQPQFQQGYASNMADMIERQRQSGNPYDLVNGSLGQRQKLGMVFPQGAANFNRAQGLEGDMSKTAYETLGGSPTAGRIESDALFDTPMKDAATDLAMSVGTGGIPSPKTISKLLLKARDSYKLGFGDSAKAKADALAPLLLNPDPAANLTTLSDILKANAARQQYLNNARAMGGMFGAPIAFGLSNRGF